MFKNKAQFPQKCINIFYSITENLNNNPDKSIKDGFDLFTFTTLKNAGLKATQVGFNMDKPSNWVVLTQRLG